MGTFSVKVRLRNWQNRFLPEDQRGEEVVCDAIVDSGATELAIPSDVVERLRLVELDKTTAYNADGRRREYRVTGMVELEVEGRRCQVRAVELPAGARPLLGSYPLEEMDWHIDPSCGRLVPSPQSPDRPMILLC